jgi:hypothetical protein
MPDAVDPRSALKQALSEMSRVDLSWIQPPPTSDGWTLAPDALRLVTRVVEILRPRHVLELGSGLSTRVLARAAGGLGNGAVISSVDHDPQYNWESGGSPREPGSAPVAFHLAPLVVREFGGKLCGAYLLQPEKLASKEPVDLVVIDGPPVNLGGREGTLYQVMDVARPGTLVLLDDSKRPEERAAIRAWQDNLGDAVSIEQLPGFAKGMAAIVVNRPVPAKALWRHRFDLSRHEVERAVPEGQMLLVAGESWWSEELAADRTVFPFTERDGMYWGEPADDAAAIAEFDRQVLLGIRFLLFPWPASWWLGHYTGLAAELKRRGRAVVRNDRMVLFELPA